MSLQAFNVQRKPFFQKFFSPLTTLKKKVPFVVKIELFMSKKQQLHDVPPSTFYFE